MPMNPGAGPDMGPEEFWDLHGASLYALAGALIGDDAAALRVVPQAMVDLYSSAGEEHVSREITLKSAAACVYVRCQAGLAEVPTPGTRSTPQTVVSLRHLEGAGRAALALCVFGGHTYRQAAAQLDLPSEAAADLVTSGLRDLRVAMGTDTTG